MNHPPSAGRISVTISDGVASIEIDNRDRRNALTRSMCLELQRVVPALDADDEVVVVTLRGAAGTFSAGAAIGELTEVLLDEQPDGTRIDQLTLADQALGSLSKPTVAIVDGACMGGGWQLASACDFIVASERSTLGITPAKLGVIYPQAGIERLVRQVGEATAKYVLFTGATFSARQAQALGLVADVIPDAGFAERVDALIAGIRDNSQFSVQTLKRLIDASPDQPDLWKDAWDAMAKSPDMAIGVAAFLERKRPAFRWTGAQNVLL